MRSGNINFRNTTMSVNLGDFIKIDTWWKAVFYLGVGGIIASMFLTITFIENKHLFGFSLGMIMIGISHWIAEREHSDIKPPNAYTGPAAFISWKTVEHNWFTKIVLLIGILFVVIFGYYIIKKLI